jgi:dihydrofolate reductase
MFIASSLDGFIAREDGSIDWLFTDNDYGYQEFYQSVDAVIMGRKTFEKGLELGCGINPTKDKKNYIFSRDQRPSNGKEKDDDDDDDEVEFVGHDIIEFVERLVNSSGKDIWLVGGSEIISLLLKANLLHDIILSIHPKILGKGIPLFKNIRKEMNLKLINCNAYDSGLIQLHYIVFKNEANNK